MRLEWIEDILAVYDAGSLRAAADLRLLTPSAFTRRVKAVEEALGVALLDRGRKPLTLRPHVVELIPRLREVAASLHQMHSDLRGVGTQGPLARLICQHTLSISWAPKVSRYLAATGRQLRIRVGSLDECAMSVLKNDSDFALVYESPEASKAQDADLFERIKISVEEFLPIAALDGNKDLDAAIRTKRVPIIAYPRNLFLGQMLERTLSRRPDQSLAVFTIAETGLGPAVFEFVRQGLGIGWIPRALVMDEIHAGTLKSLKTILPTFTLDVVGLRAAANTSASTNAIWSSILEGSANQFARGFGAEE